MLVPVFSIALVIFYYDQRVRKEGFDILWMMQQAGLSPIHAEATFTPAEESPAATDESQRSLPGETGISTPAVAADSVGEA